MKPYYDHAGVTIYNADVLRALRELPPESVQTAITSPPYWGLRDYGAEGQIGLEETPAAFVQKMVEVFREVRRVLRKDGTLWLNIGDSYYSGFKGDKNRRAGKNSLPSAANFDGLPPNRRPIDGLKPKDLCGIPWRVALALQADGWHLRADCIWAKPNPMPESVYDRPTKAHEYVFLLAKSERYFYDAKAIEEPSNGWNGSSFTSAQDVATKPNLGQGERTETDGKNKRTVWNIPTEAFPDAHFATFPTEIPRIGILAGTSEKGACSKCGAPHRRILEKGPGGYYQVSAGWDVGPCPHGAEMTGKWKNKDGEASKRIIDNVKAARDAGGDHDHPFPPRKTLGWGATCKCKGADIVPCVVLDPFHGAGTTGVVAKELRRRYIGTEIKEEYVKISIKRYRQDILPMGI